MRPILTNDNDNGNLIILYYIRSMCFVATGTQKQKRHLSQTVILYNIIYEYSRLLMAIDDVRSRPTLVIDDVRRSTSNRTTGAFVPDIRKLSRNKK